MRCFGCSIQSWCSSWLPATVNTANPNIPTPNVDKRCSLPLVTHNDPACYGCLFEKGLHLRRWLPKSDSVVPTPPPLLLQKIPDKIWKRVE